MDILKELKIRFGLTPKKARKLSAETKEIIYLSMKNIILKLDPANYDSHVNKVVEALQI